MSIPDDCARARRLWARVLVFIVIGWASSAGAQSPPVDLPDLSLSELLEVEMLDLSGDASEEVKSDRFYFAYRYAVVKFEGYRDGTRRVPNSELLVSPPPTPGKFVILPTRIIQQAHTFHFSYRVLDGTTVSVMFPYIHQNTEHISTVPGFAAFDIDSSGIGDIPITVRQRLWQGQGHSFSLSAGMSFPSGSIDERGDTPAPGLSNPLPYTMQLGSGTYDVVLGASYLAKRAADRNPGFLGELNVGARLSGKVRTGRNAADYRLGNILQGALWLQASPTPWFRPKVSLSTQIWGRIVGGDARVPNAPPPAPVANPALYGGEKLILSLGVELSWPRALVKRWGLTGLAGRVIGGHVLEVEGGFPIYQSLNGPQPEQDWQMKVGLRARF